MGSIEKLKQWSIDNPERFKEQQRLKSRRNDKRRRTTPEGRAREAARRRAQRKKNPERFRKQRLKYLQNNPHFVSMKSRHRDARKRNATLMIHSTSRQIISCIYSASKRISDCTLIPHHVDHIIPISKGGFHIPTNLQILPSKINLRKSSKLPFELLNIS